MALQRLIRRWSSSTTREQPVRLRSASDFGHADRTDYLPNESIVIKNDRGAKYLAFDAIDFYFNAP